MIFGLSTMNEPFCSNCNYIGTPNYELGRLWLVVGFIFAGFAAMFLCAPSLGLFVICGGIAALCFAGSYSTRSIQCGMCGSGDVIPGFSPKAQEFRLRHQAFEHANNHIQTGQPTHEIQYPAEPDLAAEPIDITPETTERSADRLSAFPDSILKQERNS